MEILCCVPHPQTKSINLIISTSPRNVTFSQPGITWSALERSPARHTPSFPLRGGILYEVMSPLLIFSRGLLSIFTNLLQLGSFSSFLLFAVWEATWSMRHWVSALDLPIHSVLFFCYLTPLKKTYTIHLRCSFLFPFVLDYPTCGSMWEAAYFFFHIVIFYNLSSPRLY